MKTRILSVGLLIVFLITFFAGCFKIKYEWDGRFSYYYEKNGDFYVIARLTEDEEQAHEAIETLYVPSHYKGKEVRYTWYESTEKTFLYPIELGVSPYNIKNLYLSYLTQPYDNSSYYWSGGMPQHTFLINNQYDKSMRWYTFQYSNVYNNVEQRDKSIYVTSIAYKEIKKDFYFHYEKIVEKEYCFIIKINDNTTLVSIANGAYYFNYENSPNDNYFFIDNFEQGDLVKNTPYEPIRDGYNFAGWYKEPECVNAWNFGVDTMPEMKIDANGEEIFEEVKFYAKWNKI